MESVSKILAALVLGCTILSCTAHGTRMNQNYQDVRLKPQEESLRCYDCNSLYDPRCGDPFNDYTIGVINCTDRKPPEQLYDDDNRIPPKPVVCRKLVQKIEGVTRVVRGCGYLRDDRDDKLCVIRSGTKNVNVAYCACSTSLCNTGHQFQRPSFSIIIFTIVVPFAIRILLHIRA